MKNILSFRLFSRVARLADISVGARDCSLSQPQASRIITELETVVGARPLA